MIALQPPNEPDRLRTLHESGLLDSLPEAVYDDIVSLAAFICRTPISLVSLVDTDRQWFKAKTGVEVSQTSREVSFCAHALLEASGQLVVPDAKADARFVHNGLVTGDPHIRFYAGMTIHAANGSAMGTLCVIDREPRSLAPEQLDALRRLARLVDQQFLAHQQRQKLSASEKVILDRAAELGRLNMLLHSEIEDRKAIEGALRQREEQLRDLFENATDLIQSVALDGRLLFVNRAWLSTLGYRVSDLGALTVFDIIHPDCLAECQEHFARVMKGESLNNLQAIFRAKDGQQIHVEGNVSARLEDGRVVASRGIFRDITRRKAVEAERERLITELQTALAEVKTLSGLLPVCGWCRKIRDDSGYWNSLESYLKQNAGVDVTHGICPECSKKLMAEMDRLVGPAPAESPKAS